MRVGALFLASTVGFVAGGVPDRFVPPTDLAGETIVMPAVFPDGGRLELRYPRALGLAELGVRPYSSGDLGAACTGTYCGRDFAIFYGRAAAAVIAGTVIERYRGNAGKVELRRSRRGDERLVFRFGRWSVGVWENGSMTKRDKALWARSLSGAVTSEGYLVLSARSPLRLARAGDHAGPELMVGDSARRMVLLIRGRCQPGRRTRSSWFSSWCVPRARVRIHVYGQAHFADRLFSGLEIRTPR